MCQVPQGFRLGIPTDSRAIGWIGLSWENTQNVPSKSGSYIRGGNTVETKTVNHEGKIVLSVSGRVDTSTAPELEKAINKEIDSGSRKVLLDFSGVTYISSGGLRVLLATAKKLKNPGDKFGLCNLSPEVLKILKLAGFTSIFSIYPSEGEALAGW
jgi:anti-sigma B factor antagonist